MKMLAYLKYLEAESVKLRHELVKLHPLEILDDINRNNILQITAYLEYGHMPTLTTTSYRPYILVGIFSCGCTYLNGDLLIANILGLGVLIWWLLTPTPKSYIIWPTCKDDIDPEVRNSYLRRIRFHMSV